MSPPSGGMMKSAEMSAQPSPAVRPQCRASEYIPITTANCWSRPKRRSAGSETPKSWYQAASVQMLPGP